MNKAKSKRRDLALEVLAAGGYFRKALETQFRGGEKFVVRLRTKSGSVVRGVGFATLYVLLDEGLLTRRDCPRSSLWPEEWELKGGAK